jgi:DNA-binding SARP family transcriptional activator/tetratricopeptide (TPR) repeat protein
MDSDGASHELLLRHSGRFLRRGGRDIDLEPKDAMLLAYLAVEGPTPRGRLATLLWPDADEERARGNLRQRLLRLRRTTGAELVVGNPLMQLAGDVEHDLAGTYELLHGLEPQEDGFAEWLNSQRERRRREYADRLAAATAQAEADRDLDAALGHASALADLEPLSEHAHRRLMTIHYLRGDVGAALAAYERCREALQNELSAQPSRETEALHASIMRAGNPPADGAPASVGVPLPITVLRPPRMVGRERELSELERAWGEERVFVVAGEGGMGKSRLLSEFLGGRADVVMVQARPGDTALPYATMARLLRAVVGRVPRALTESAQPQIARLLPEVGSGASGASHGDASLLLQAVHDTLARAAAAGVRGIVVDDLHFADAHSGEMLRDVILEQPAATLRWGVALRPAEPSAVASQSLIDVLEMAMLARHTSIGSLGAAALAELVDSLGIPQLKGAALAEPLLRHSGGNPLFVLETLKGMLVGADDSARLPMPSTVGALIERRLRQLSPQALMLARVAALAGADFSIHLAEYVLQVPALALSDAWRDLQDAQVIRGAAFAHDLVYEAVLRTVPATIARHTRGTLADYLELHAGEPARIARHWEAAGQPTRAVPWLVKAADVAGARGATSEQIDLLERAATIDADAGEHDREFETRLRLANVYERTTLNVANEANVERLSTLAATPPQRGFALAARANLLQKRGALEASIEPLREALAIAREHDVVDLACDAANWLTSAYGFLARFDEALATIEAARPMFDRGGEDWQMQFLSAHAVALNNVGRPVDARADIEAALRLARSRGELAAQVSLSTNLAINFRSCGLLAESIRAAEEAERVQALADPNPRTGINIHLVLGVNLRDRGHYRAALERLTRVLDLVDENTPMFRQPALNVLALLYLQLGQPARAQQLLQESERYLQVARWLVARTHLQKGLLLQRLGKPAAASFEQALDIAPATGRPLVHLHARLALAAIEGGDAGYSRAADVERAAQAGQFAGMRIVAHAALARIALADGAPQRAATHAREAIRLLEGADPDETYRGDIWLAAYQALHAAGDPGAVSLLQHAVTWIRRTADEDVPPEYRDSFLNRNPVNRELLTLATRRG